MIGMTILTPNDLFATFTTVPVYKLCMLK